MDEDRLARKASALIGGEEAALELSGVLDDADRPAADLLSAIGWPG
jgi:hypothetical protein